MAPNNALAKSKLGERRTTRSSTRTSPVGGDPTFDVTQEWLDDQAVLNAPNRAAAKSTRDREGAITSDEVEARGDGVVRGPKAWEPKSRIGVEVKSVLTCMMFLTRLPVPSFIDHNPRFLVPGMLYFPILGALIGVWAAAWFDAAIGPLGPDIAAALSTATTVWLTGSFHEDGLADTLDGLGGGWGRDQILRIMKDSRCGTYAVVGTSLWIFAKITAISRAYAAGGSSVAAVILVSHVVGRTVAVALTAWTDYVHDEGDDKGLLYNTFAGCLRSGLLSSVRVFLAIVAAAGVTWVLLPMNLAGAVLGMAAAAFLFSRYYALEVLGGVIGDFLGAVICCVELATLVICGMDFKGLDSGALWRLAAVALWPLLCVQGAGDLPWVRKDKKNKQKVKC